MQRLCSLILSALLVSGAAWGRHWHESESDWKWHAQHGDDDDRDIDHHHRSCYFEPQDVRLISQYYGMRYRPIPRSLAGKYSRGGELPHGWESRIEFMPAAVERQLARVPDSYRRGIIDGFACTIRETV
jgi:hypothetical protein